VVEAAKNGRFNDAAVGVRGPSWSGRDLLGEPLTLSVAVEVARVVGENAFDRIRGTFRSCASKMAMCSGLSGVSTT
jgi:hypothetical protein